jgi:hypothetical protein
VSNDLRFDSNSLRIEDCTINPAIGPGSPADKTLTRGSLGPGVERVGVFSLTNREPIPSGPLYICAFTVTAGSPGERKRIPNTPGASDADGVDLLTEGSDGEVYVTACNGDCNGDGRVTVDEVVRAVNLYLGKPFCNASQPLLSCPVADTNLDGRVSIGEVMQAVNRFLSGCP